MYLAFTVVVVVVVVVVVIIIIIVETIHSKGKEKKEKIVCGPDERYCGHGCLCFVSAPSSSSSWSMTCWRAGTE